MTEEAENGPIPEQLNQRCTLCSRWGGIVFRNVLDEAVPYRLCLSCVHSYGGMDDAQVRKFRRKLAESAAQDNGEPKGNGTRRYLNGVVESFGWQPSGEASPYTCTNCDSPIPDADPGAIVAKLLSRSLSISLCAKCTDELDSYAPDDASVTRFLTLLAYKARFKHCGFGGTA